MKKALLLSVVASTMMMAGGDIAPIVEETPIVVEDNGFYLGLAYGFMNVNEQAAIGIDPDAFDEDFSSVMLQAGYKFNSYFAVEGRYWFGLDDVAIGTPVTETIDAPDAWGIYAKPMFPVMDSLDIYGLVGYASTDITRTPVGGPSVTDNYNGFSWGLGLDYEITESFAIFADYVVLTDSTEGFRDINVDTINVGVTYQF